MYLIFGGLQYYASGGGYDYLDMELNKSDAIKAAEGMIGKEGVWEVAEGSDDRDDDMSYEIEWTHVVDSNNGKVLATFGKNPFGGGYPVTEIRTMSGG